MVGSEGLEPLVLPEISYLRVTEWSILYHFVRS
jgi:hypothetical protein